MLEYFEAVIVMLIFICHVNDACARVLIVYTLCVLCRLSVQPTSELIMFVSFTENN